jgi:hypothetical protein
MAAADCHAASRMVRISKNANLRNPGLKNSRTDSAFVSAERAVHYVKIYQKQCDEKGASLSLTEKKLLCGINIQNDLGRYAPWLIF